ncbi:MAG TPA: AAA family ATPase [Clostridium sp.]|uniref:ATP-dependent nuclease n=1 Tax=Clostridium sp. TaxID=1506 RepID=UPI002F9398E1
MKFKNLHIQNFRNFEDVTIGIANFNIIFGVNDIGKTNLLYAIRFMLDRKHRICGCLDSDYYKKDTLKPIIITLILDIEDEEDNDNKKIFNKIKGVLMTGEKELCIELRSDYNDEHLIGEIEMRWGSTLETLETMPRTQQSFEVDKIFNVIYIDSSIQMENVFNRYTKYLFRNEKTVTKEEKDSLIESITDLNKHISEIKSIIEFEGNISTEYKKYRNENINIKIKSEVEMDNIYSKLVPYMTNGDDITYPTSGDGRKKIIEYSILSLESRELEDHKINIFLIEEIENHLHRSMQISLSYQIFEDNLFKYLFMTTHSSQIVSRMDNVNLIKLSLKDKIIGKSYYYKVPPEYKELKSKLNENLSEAIFADNVLLIEGPSESIIFKRILETVNHKYECNGNYILQVDGINFKEYYKILDCLGIKIIVKTDNDLKFNNTDLNINLLGINRCLTLIKNDKVKNIKFKNITTKEEYENKKIKLQEYCFKKLFADKVNIFKENNIFLSQVDLENDLYEVIPKALDKFISTQNTSKCAIDYLQQAKLINMIELCKNLTAEDCKTIFNSSLFECLKRLVE